MGVPTFCPIHLKIHECPENSNKAISSATENKIKAKMNRMLNPTNTSEPDKSTKDEKGTIQYILANAKKNNNDIKNKLGLEDEESKSLGVDENDIKAKMARLRAAVTGNKDEVGDHNNIPAPTLTSKKDSGLQEIIDNAYRINRGIERIKSEKEEQQAATTIKFTDDDLDQLNIEMHHKQIKKDDLNASKQKNSTNYRTKTVKNDSNKTIPTVKKPKSKTTSTSSNSVNNKTVILTTAEIEELIEKAVNKAMAKEKDIKKKRGS